MPPSARTDTSVAAGQRTPAPPSPRTPEFRRQVALLTATGVVGCAAAVAAWLGASSVARWTVIVFAGAIALRLAIRIVRDLLRGHTGIDILALTAIVATLVVGENAAAMVIVIMLTGGEALDEYASHRAKRELTALMTRAPRVAHRAVGSNGADRVDGAPDAEDAGRPENADHGAGSDSTQGSAIVDIPVDTVQPGDVLLVRPSEIVPVDGVLRSASASFDESSLTGESMPVERVTGEPVMSGAVNGTAAILMTATSTAATSQYSQIVDLVREATEGRSPLVRLADRYALPFTVVSYAIAAAAWIASGDAVRFAAVLVVATPCPLLLAAPVAFLGGMSRAAKHGIIVKNGTALELAAHVRTVAFDKTGTLTDGRPTLLRVVTASGTGVAEDEVLAAAAAAEQHSSHVLAASVTQAAVDRGLPLDDVADAEEWATHGVKAAVGRREVVVGKPAFVAETTGAVEELDLSGGELAVYVGIDGRYAGALLLADPPRPDAAQVVGRLRALGIEHVMMLTGDAEPTAQVIARQVGVTDVRPECLPVDKVAAVRNERARPIMMVGDGVNDAPVLAAADIGVAMGARGATAAAQSALAVLLKDRLGLVADLVAIGRRTVAIALQSIWIGIGLSIVLMGVAAFGHLPPLFGALSQEAVDLAAIGNALRALTSARPNSRRRTPSGGDTTVSAKRFTAS